MECLGFVCAGSDEFKLCLVCAFDEEFKPIFRLEIPDPRCFDDAVDCWAGKVGLADNPICSNKSSAAGGRGICCCCFVERGSRLLIELEFLLLRDEDERSSVIPDVTTFISL